MLFIDYIVNNLSIHQNVITGPSSENDRLLSGKLSNALVCYVVTLNVSFILYFMLLVTSFKYAHNKNDCPDIIG